jgi:tetratricopeptide (TPR) repeat protein
VRPRRQGLAAGALALALLAGCATPQSDAMLAARAAGEVMHLPVSALAAGVPIIAQDDFYCGPASLAMALRWSGVETGADQVAPQVFTPARQGSLANDMLAAARRHGRLAVAASNLDEMFGEVAAGHPVVVLLNLGLEWIPKWHFAVVVGYDLAAEEVDLHDGGDAPATMKLATFERVWTRGGAWALTVLPPSRLPARAPESAVEEAALGLERAKRPAEAAMAYEAILRRWPGSALALVGAGNALHAMGDRRGAEAAFQRAVERRPDIAAGWTNLALVLAARGEDEAARHAARRALAAAAAGAREADYRDALGSLASFSE